jgi:carboxypeptidase Taq
MPPGAAAARADQLAALSEVTHGMATADETRKLLEAAEQENKGIEGEMAVLLRNARYDFDRLSKIPVDLAAELSRHSALAQDVWQKARAANDFNSFSPLLEKSVELQVKVADLLGYESERYDALLDGYERGARTTDIAEMFATLKPDLVALTRAIKKSPIRDQSNGFSGSFPAAAQNDLTLNVVARLGYDLHHGRQDRTTHPFCASFSRWDVRITTRFQEDDIFPAFFASLHEAGHALYEQGLPAEHDNGPLGGAVSSGVHESQSRLYENLVGRSRPFAEYAAPLLSNAFPDVFGDLAPDTFYRAANRVRPSLIRVEADEVTYNLHILLRFELERMLIRGELAVRSLPEEWNQRMESYVGITPRNHGDGVLQDVHWAAGLFGYFPTYTLGNVMSGQLWHAIRRTIPNLDDQMRAGQFGELLSWLRRHVHAHGRRYLPSDLIRRATGERLNARYYLNYLRAKYEDLYELA